jgi:predicted nicotinamide N-methyase
MKAGAREATAIDVDPDAIDAIALNAKANAATVAALCGDPLDGPAPAVDLVLVGDLFYEAGLAARATAFLDRCRLAGVGALIGGSTVSPNIGSPISATRPTQRRRRAPSSPLFEERASWPT